MEFFDSLSFEEEDLFVWYLTFGIISKWWGPIWQPNDIELNSKETELEDFRLRLDSNLTCVVNKNWLWYESILIFWINFGCLFKITHQYNEPYFLARNIHTITIVTRLFLSQKASKTFWQLRVVRLYTMFLKKKKSVTWLTFFRDNV